MEKALKTLLILILTCSFAFAQTDKSIKSAGSVFLEKTSWLEAERQLQPESVVIIALGAASKQHGPHLPLSSDFIQAEFVKDRVAERTKVVVAPSINYGFYPPFSEYPGSTTLRLSVSRDMIADICRSLARTSKARRFYVVNHGVITTAVLSQVVKLLNSEGLLFGFTDLEQARASVVKEVRQQQTGQHADEIETSMLLYMAPELVDMKKAVKEYGAAKEIGGRMIGNRPVQSGVFSPSGVYGDPTLATREKGKKITEALIAETLKDIEALRRAPLPPAVSTESFFDDVIGLYETSVGNKITVTKEGNLLAVETPGQSKALLQAVGKQSFGLWMTEARFITDEASNAVYLILSANGKDVLAKKIK